MPILAAARPLQANGHRYPFTLGSSARYSLRTMAQSRLDSWMSRLAAEWPDSSKSFTGCFEGGSNRTTSS